MVSKEVSNVAYILLIVLTILGAIYDIFSKKYVNLHFISIIIILIALLIDYPTFKKDRSLLYLPSFILLFIAFCMQTYSHYKEDKKFTYRIKFIILFLAFLLLFLFYKIYYKKLIYY